MRIDPSNPLFLDTVDIEGILYFHFPNGIKYTPSRSLSSPLLKRLSKKNIKSVKLPSYGERDIRTRAVRWFPFRKQHGISLLCAAPIVILEFEGELSYVKNRLGPTTDKVDLKEFLYIKLSSVDVW